MSLRKFFIDSEIILFFDPQASSLWLNSGFFVEKVKLPSFYFYFPGQRINFVFLTKFFFSSFLSNFKVTYNNLYSFRFLKLRIKGLGYRVRKIYNKLYKFFFSTTFFYFHVPKNMFFRVKRKHILCVSNNFRILKTVFNYMFLLNKLNVYRVRGLIKPKQIINLKIGKQNV